ncbi:MAG: hypothetical protein ACYTGN_09290 [Planctomycetota bacterium]|jgi:hypothetical protein
MGSVSKHKRLSGLFAGPGGDWRDSIAYRERVSEWEEEYRQVKTACGSAVPYFVLAPLCAFGFMVFSGVWAILCGIAAVLVLLAATVMFRGAPAYRQRMEELDRERNDGLLPSIPQVRSVLERFRPGACVVHVFPDGRVVRFDSTGVCVANIGADRLDEHGVAGVEPLADDAPAACDVIVHTRGGDVATFPFGADAATARAACEILQGVPGTGSELRKHA